MFKNDLNPKCHGIDVKSLLDEIHRSQSKQFDQSLVENVMDKQKSLFIFASNKIEVIFFYSTITSIY